MKPNRMSLDELVRLVEIILLAFLRILLTSIKLIENSKLKQISYHKIITKTATYVTINNSQHQQFSINCSAPQVHLDPNSNLQTPSNNFKILIPDMQETKPNFSQLSVLPPLPRGIENFINTRSSNFLNTISNESNNNINNYFNMKFTKTIQQNNNRKRYEPLVIF